MPNTSKPNFQKILEEIAELRRLLGAVDSNFNPTAISKKSAPRVIVESRLLMEDLRRVREKISPIRFDAIDITLGRSDSVAKFFTFNFIRQEKQPLKDLAAHPFYGSGVYAIYYHGKGESAYQLLSGTETPIYIGKADPKIVYAESAEEQGSVLHTRLKEHAKSLTEGGLKLSNFRYRASAIQSGMQAAVETFMMQLFRPIWNKENKVCFGIGKHGDKASTRGNRRSPWDTMHPGRSWADATAENQMHRHEIEAKIAEHFQKYPIIADKESLYDILTLAGGSLSTGKNLFEP